MDGLPHSGIRDVDAVFRDAHKAVVSHCTACLDEDDMTVRLVDGLGWLRRGEFDLDGSTLFDLWDALGMCENRTDDLESLYKMLEAMRDICQSPASTDSINFGEN